MQPWEMQPRPCQRWHIRYWKEERGLLLLEFCKKNLDSTQSGKVLGLPQFDTTGAKKRLKWDWKARMPSWSPQLNVIVVDDWNTSFSIRLSPDIPRFQNYFVRLQKFTFFTQREPLKVDDTTTTFQNTNWSYAAPLCVVHTSLVTGFFFT